MAPSGARLQPKVYHCIKVDKNGLSKIKVLMRFGIGYLNKPNRSLNNNFKNHIHYFQ